MSNNYNSFSPRRTLYRSRSGLIFGVCKGLATYAEVSTVGVRLAFIIAVLLSGVWPMVLIYLVAAIFIKPAPLVAPENIEDWAFYNTYATDRKAALAGLKRKFDNLERRTRRVETIVTSPEYQWDRRFRS